MVGRDQGGPQGDVHRHAFQGQHGHEGVSHRAGVPRHEAMVAGESGQDQPAEDGAAHRKQQHAARFHGPGEPDGTFAASGQRPQEAEDSGGGQTEDQVRPGLLDRADGAQATSEQHDEEDHLPEQGHPLLKEGALLLAVLGA